MTTPARRRPALVALTTTLALLASVLVPTTASAAEAEITFAGRGWGHGRGMGQYGALGYAVDHGWGYQRILDHFYGGTTLGSVGEREITVELHAMTGKPLVVAGKDVRVNGIAVGAAARLTALPNGSVKVESGTSCASPTWSPVAGTFPVNGTRVATPLPGTTLDNLLRICEASFERAYRGSLSVVSHGGQQWTINHLPTEEYLQGVVPRESPAAWGTIGGGAGMHALRAQSVAARSYALAPPQRATGADTCDTITCQVYGGAGIKRGATWESLEAHHTNQAIRDTAGQVRMRNGQVMRTEFSSSTGGWTAGGTFPAVVDAGDATSRNPNHTWRTTMTLASAGSRLGTGPIRSIAVTGRNGLGADGGRVTEVTVTTTSGASRKFTGNEVRSKLGLKSDWFSISSLTPAEADAIVRALYEDLLGRAVDPTGRATWTNRLLTGTSQSELVHTLTRSDEYIERRITEAYRTVLGRAPERTGMAYWKDAIIHGRATVDDVKRRFFDSQEFYNRSGGSPERYVDLLYQAMFERPASAAEQRHWAGRIRATNRTQVVDGIWFSMEAAMYRAGGYYRLFLKREPDWSGQTHWARILLSRGEGDVRTGIAGSLEYRQLAVRRFP